MDTFNLWIIITILSFYHLIDKHHLVFSVISGPMGVILTIICLVDAGHLFRINRRLGGSQSYLFFGSLPVSKGFTQCQLHQLHSINFDWCFNH